MSGKYPSPPPLATSETIGVASESGFQVEFREGYFYIRAVPEGCTDIKVGDRVLEINGVKAFNFGSATTANNLFDTVCMVYIPKEELVRKTNGKKKYHDDDSTSSEESNVSRSRRGRRSMYEEEARQIGAQRLSTRNLEETLKKEKQEEKELRKIEREIRQLQRADRERREDQEKRRSRVSLTNFPSIPTSLTNGQRPSILFSPPATSNKKTLRSSIMESITKSPSTSDRKTRASMADAGLKSPSASDRKKSPIRHSIAVPPPPPASPAPLTSEQPKKKKEERKKDRIASPAPGISEKSKKIKEKKKGRSVSPAPLSSSEEPKKKKKERSDSPGPMGEKKRERKSGMSVSSDPVTRKSGSISSEEKKKERKSGISVSSDPPPPTTEVPKKSRPRNPVNGSLTSPRNDAPKMPKRRSSVMVERKVRELEERAARERNATDAPISPEQAMASVIQDDKNVKVDRKLGKHKGGSSKRWSKQSPNHKSNGP